MALDFEAPGDEASALLRAHELGCLPEAALTLVALTDYRLVGAAAENGLLHTENTWPAAWRVHAARCHRALAVGCDDDVDLLLRIFAEWQMSSDPNGWCATWWINPTVMKQIEADVANVFTNLATAGPIGMRHPVDPNRAPLVRDAIASAHPTAEYVASAPGEYRSAASEGTGPIHRLSPSVLVEPGPRFIALGRDSEQLVIQHIVDVPTAATPSPVSDPLAAVRTQWPVGSVVEIETLGSVADGRIILDILTVNRGFAYPEGASPAPAPAKGELPELVAVAAHTGNPIDGAARSRVRVTGYDLLDDSSTILLVDPLQAGAPIDPSEHPDLGTWDDVEVAVHGMTADHYGPLLELGRTDGLGGFVIPPAAGLAADDTDFGARLVEGAVLTARVIPEPPIGDHVTVSLLPTVLRHLESFPGINDHQPVAGRIIAREDGVLTVELTHRDDSRGISHRFAIGLERLGSEVQPLAGTEVGVVLQPDRSPERRRIAANRGLVDFASRNADTFEITDGWLRLAPSPPNIPAVLALLSFSSSPEWEREVVWMYEDNLHLEAALAGAPHDAALARTAATSPGFLLPTPSRSVEMAATEEAAPAEAAGPRPMLVATLPPGGADRVRGRDGEALLELRQGPGVISVELEDETVTIVGETGKAVRSVVSEIQRLILPAKGKLIVPPGQGKRLIGIDGTTLRALEAKTGSKALPPQNGELWGVEGPSSQAVKAFIRLAAEQVPGVAGRVTGIEDLEVIEDRTIPGQGNLVRPSSIQSHAPSSSATPQAAAVTDAGEAAEPETSPRNRPLTVREMQAAVVKAEKSRRSEVKERKPRRKRLRRDETSNAEAPGQTAGTIATKRKAAVNSISQAAGLLLKTLVLVLVAGAVAVAILLVVPRFAGSGTDVDTTIADTISTSALTASAVAFATLEDSSTAAVDSCWLAVMATWDTADQANEGSDRLAELGLASSALASERVPGWSPGKVVSVVASETAAQAADVVARAAPEGFRGLPVESTTSGCAGLDVVPAGASLGFVDVPMLDPSYAAVLWMANTGLTEPCNAPIGDKFCPDTVVTTDELNQTLADALASSPSDLSTAAGPATLGDLTSALELDTTADPAQELTRKELAMVLYEVYEAAN